MALTADLIVDRVIFKVELSIKDKRKHSYYYIVIKGVVYYKIT
jgi:hypothetical protein